MFSSTTIRRRNLYFTVFTVNLMYLSAGEAVTWTSPTIPKLILPNPVLQITKEQGGFITISTASGQLLGPIMNGLLIGKVGRKGTICVALCLYIVHWFIISWAWNIESILFARVLSGTAVGITMSCVPLYIAEIAEDDIRGVLNSFAMTSRSTGYLICYSIGPFVPYIWLVFICTLVPLTLVFLLTQIPESPYYLIMNGRLKEAQKSLSWLRGTSPENVKTELDTIQASVKKARAEKTKCTEFFHSPANVRALELCGAVRFAQEANGITVFVNVMQMIIITSQVPISSDVSCIIVGSMFLLSSFAGPTVVSLYGYKKPLVVSFIGIVISLIVLGFHFYLVDNGYIEIDSSDELVTLVPIVCLIVQCVLYCGGVSSISFALAGEMFAPNVKRFGASASNFVGFLMGDFTVIYYNEMKGLIGTSNVIWTFATLTSLGALFTMIFLPETSTMTLDEIQKCLNKPFVKVKKPNKYEINTVP